MIIDDEFIDTINSTAEELINICNNENIIILNNDITSDTIIDEIKDMNFDDIIYINYRQDEETNIFPERKQKMFIPNKTPIKNRHKIQYKTQNIRNQLKNQSRKGRL